MTAQTVAAPRCDHTDPGIPSINHPDRPIAPPWQCVHDAGHAGGHGPVQVCPEVALRKQGYDWPCVYAIGHAGEHRPPTGARHIARPLREMDRDELVTAALLAFTNADLAQQNARALNQRLDLWQRQVEALAAHALDGVKSPHGNSHTADCWTKHPHCFAYAIIGSGGLNRALESLRSTAAGS